MSELSTNVERLSDRARVQRIAVLLCKAITRGEAQQAVSISMPAIASPPCQSGIDDYDAGADARIVGFLRFVGSASPATIRATLSLSRSTTHRALSRLTRIGSVVRSGQTRTLEYRLGLAEPPPEKLGLN